MELIIGREGNQPLKITDPHTSRKHAAIRRLPNGQYELEDLNSTWGTWIIYPDNSAQRIIKCTVHKNTRIRLGDRLEANINDLIKEAEDDLQLAEGFNKLEEVYNQYIADKKALQKELFRSNFYRTIPSIIMTVAFGISMIIGRDVDWVVLLQRIFGILMIVLIILSSWLIINKGSKGTDKLLDLEEKFKVDFVCPKCHTFPGPIPFEALKNKKTCPVCKAKWTTQE